MEILPRELTATARAAAVAAAGGASAAGGPVIVYWNEQMGGGKKKGELGDDADDPHSGDDHPTTKNVKKSARETSQGAKNSFSSSKVRL